MTKIIRGINENPLDAKTLTSRPKTLQPLPRAAREKPAITVLNDRRRTVIVIPLSSSPNASPPILIPIACGGKPAVAVSDQIRAVAKERVQSRLRTVTSEEIAALEDGLRLIMQL